jgi:hypothetical protein
MRNNMPIQMTPIVGVSTRKGLSEFKVRSKEEWILQNLREKIENWCTEMGIDVEKKW